MPELNDMITISQAAKLAKEHKRKYTRAHLAYVARNGDIEGAIKLDVGPNGTWFIPHQAFMDWLSKDRRPGPKTEN